jgi:hypothetical protein
MPEEFHSQDWLLIIEALTRYAGPEVETPRQCRAWSLAETIADREGLALTGSGESLDGVGFDRQN